MQLSRPDSSDGPSLRSGFLAQAIARPDAPALVIQSATRTYGELDATARTWAGAICDALNGPAERVGVLGYRSELTYTGALAALCSGAAFVPLDRTFPIERTRAMIEASRLDAIIADQQSVPQLERLLEGISSCPVVLAPEDNNPVFRDAGRTVFGESALRRRQPLGALPPVLKEEVAYLLFTSGSTGAPKGVPVSHANVLHFLEVMQERYRIRPDDRFSQTTPQTFDLSIFDLFLAWEHGASVYSMQQIDVLGPTRYITRNELTVWFSVPSIPALMRKKGFLKPDLFPTLRLSLFCGEPLPLESAESWQAAAPNSVLENLYGPTELTIACLLYRWDPATSPKLCVNGTVPIGRPYAGLGVLLLDENLRPVADNDVGELCVCGPQTAPGYWQDPAKTAERFVEVQVSPFSGMRFYRTGDRARRLESGDYVYLGRADHQIKVLGYRVDLGEIEAALRADPAVLDAVALGWPLEEGRALGVVAFVTGSKVDPARLTEDVRSTLPGYMVPRQITVLDAMPLNANGKIDRNALRARLEGT